MSRYLRLQRTAHRLLKGFAQGEVIYYEPGAVSGDPWNPTPVTPTAHTVNSVVRGVDARYVDGTSILASDLQVMMPVFGVRPQVGESVGIDGGLQEIVRVEPIPAAGTTVVWRVFVRA